MAPGAGFPGTQTRALQRMIGHKNWRDYRCRLFFLLTVSVRPASSIVDFLALACPPCRILPRSCRRQCRSLRHARHSKAVVPNTV
jgi:hypothetical protein